MSYTSSDLLVYRNLELESKVSEASPHQLIQMLFDGLLMQLRRAKQCAQMPDQTATRDEAIQKAIDILNGLHASLSTEVDSDLPHNLANLYDYMQRQLLRARIGDTQQNLDEVIALADTIASGWRDIAEGSAT